jgi:transposase
MFKPYQQSQAQLLPPTLDESIAKDHLARLINHVVDTMDLSFLEKQYSSQGQHAYPPAMLLKILVYGYASGVRSSRRLADKLQEDIVFMYLAGRLTPDFRTIADFRKEKLSDFKHVFTHVLEQCFALGMARVGTITVDGTAIRASANKNKVVYRKQLATRKALIEEKIAAIVEEAEALDREEERLFGNTTEHRTGRDFTDGTVAKELQKLNEKRSRLMHKKQVLNATASEIKAKEEKMRTDRNSFASADTDATVMLMKEGYIAPGYNAQLATEHQVILGYNISSDRNDQLRMQPTVEEVKANTGRMPEKVIADAGYGNKATYQYLKKQGITAFIPYGSYERDRMLRNRGIRTMPLSPDIELEGYKATQRMRLKTPHGKALMNRRREDVEPTFGNIKRNLNFRRFLLRGKTKCELEFGLVALAHNLKKIRKRVIDLCSWDDGRMKTRELGHVLGFQMA